MKQERISARKGLFLGVGLSLSMGLHAQQAKPKHTQAADDLLHRYESRIEFVENKGQFSSEVLFKADFPLGQALATREGMVIKAYDPASVKARQEEGMRIEQDMHDGLPSRPLIWREKGHGWRMRFLDSDPGMTIAQREAHTEVNNYFLGDRHATGVHSYQEVWYNNVYRGVDVRYYPAADGALEYDIICNAGSDPSRIALQLEGIDRVSVGNEGELVMHTSLGRLSFPAPVVYQSINGREKHIQAAYRISGQNIIGFTLGAYDRTLPLVIDPIAMRWATWVNTNSTGDNHGHCVWVDPNDGAIYVVARVVGTTDQITVGAFDTSANGNLEMIVGKYLEPATVGGSGTRVWQTYIGGGQDDNPYAMEQGPDGNLYITGLTGSTNFPLLGGPGFSGSSINQQAQTGDDIFVLKIDPAGTSIKSCVVGGNGTENSYDLRIGANGDVVVCGTTTATNLLTLNAGSGASNTNNGGTDYLIFKVNQDLSALNWMSNSGGSGNDVATIMVQDNTTGDIFIGGHTTSTNFPTASPRQSTRGGDQAGFLQRRTSTGAVTWSSYFSSSTNNEVMILCMEFNVAKTELYFGGLTTGLAAANISASGVYDNSYNNNTDFFVCRMETDQDFLAATYVGSSGVEENMMGLNTDQNNDVYVFGYSSGTNFPTTALPNTALQTTNLGESDKVFLKLEHDLSALLFSTYYGGSTDDYDPVGERGIKFSNCRIYTIVTAESNNIPLTQGALNTTKLSSNTSIYEPGLVVWANPPDILDNTINGNQTICSGTVPGDITGSNPSYVLPTVIRNGSTSTYPSLGSAATFQWQISTDSVNWANIPGATGQNLLGSQIGVVNVKTFIRRIIGGDACVLAGAADQVVTVNVNTVSGDVDDALCFNTATGAITATSTGTGPFTYLWSNGQTAQTATGLLAGAYSVTVTDANQCSATGNFVVGQPTAVGGSADVTLATCGDDNGGATASGSGGTPPYSYAWSTGAVGPNLSNVVAGNYSVTITDANNCAFILPVVVGGTTPPDANAGADATITCQTGPEIQLNGSSSTPGVNYGWSGPGIVSGGSTATPWVNSAGIYVLTVSAPNGCSATDAVEVTLNTTAPNVSASGGELNCTTENGIALNGGSTTPGVTFSWSGPGGFTSSDEDPTVNVPGTYTLTVTDPSNGCSASANAEVIQDIAAPNVSATGGELTCAVLSVTLNGGSTTPGVTFSWSGPGGFTSGDEDPTVSVPGIYTLTVTNPANGCSASAQAEVTQDIAAPNVSASGGTLTCGTENGIALNGGSTTPGVTFSWSGPGGFTSSDEDPTVNVPGTYTLTVTDPSNGCSASANAEVIQDVNAPTVSAQGGTLDCTVLSVILNGGSTTPGAVFSWTGPGGFTSSDEDPTVSVPGVYTLTVFAENQCSASANAEVILDNAVPGATAQGGTIDCNTDCIVLSGGGDGSYSWSGPDGFTSNDQNPTVCAAGSYTLTVTGANGCTSTAVATVILDNETPGATAQGGIIDCNTDCIVLSGGGDGSYSWSGPGGFTSNDQNPTVCAAGTYTLTVTGANGCTSSAIAEVTQNISSPDASATGGTLTCGTEAGIALNGGSTTPGVTFNWSGPGGFTSSVEDPTVNVPGTYTLTVTDPVNGCSASANAEVLQDVNAPNVSAAGGTLNCNITSVMLNGGSTTPGASFSWTGPGGFTSGDEDPVVSVPGVYTLTVTAENECSASANAEVILDTAAPGATAVGGTLDCNTVCVVLDGDGNGTYAWSGPGGFTSTDQDPTVCAPGTYTLTVTGANGCTSTATTEVDLDIEAPEGGAAGGSLTCAVTSVTLIGGGNGTIVWTGPDGFISTEQNPVVSVPGAYYLTVTGANGCTSTFTAMVLQYTIPPYANAEGGTIDCLDPSVTLDGQGSDIYGNTVSFNWTGPNGFSSTDEDPVVTEPGIYQLIVIVGSTGCTDTAYAEVTLDAEVPGATAQGGTITCTNECVILSGNGNGTYSWSGPDGFTSTEQNPTICAAGSYVLTVTGANGCTSTATAMVTLDNTIPDLVAEGAMILCDEQPVQVNATSVAATSFAWTSVNGFSSNDEDPFVSEVGFYTVTVTGANGCTNSTTVAVTHEECEKKCPLEMICPNDTTVQCGSPLTWPYLGQPYFPKKDECPWDANVWWVDEFTGTCPTILERTWYVADSDTMLQCTQLITIVDTIAPVLSGVPSDVTVECGSDVPEPLKITAEDCEGSWLVDATEERIEGKDKCSYTIIRTWTATDDCGNTSSATQTISVSDAQPPVFDCKSLEYKVGCDQKLQPSDCNASDNCDEEVDVTFTEEQSEPNKDGNYTLTWTWTAVDDCGNSAQIVHIVHVICNKENAAVLKALPNPFREGTSLQFTADRTDRASLEVTDLSGRMIARIFEGQVTEGQTYNAWFDATHDMDGTYLVKFTIGGTTTTSRIVRSH